MGKNQPFSKLSQVFLFSSKIDWKTKQGYAVDIDVDLFI